MLMTRQTLLKKMLYNDKERLKLVAKIIHLPAQKEWKNEVGPPHEQSVLFVE